MSKTYQPSQRTLLAVAILQAHRRRRGSSWRTAEVQPDGSITHRGAPVTPEEVRAWSRQGYSVIVIGRAGRTPDAGTLFPDFQHVTLHRAGEVTP